MGYRLYLGKIKTQEIEEIRQSDYNELLLKYNDLTNPDEDLYLPGPYRLIPDTLYCLGKGIDYLDKLREFGSEIFTFPEAEDYYYDYDFFSITKEGLLLIIDTYRQKVADCYKVLAYSYDIFGVEVTTTPELFIKQRAESWNETRYCNYNLDLTKKNIVTSWDYEYAVFELVYILKSIDFENETLVIYGY